MIERLKEISFEIIQRCPNNCIYCSSNSGINQEANIISFPAFQSVIDEAIQLGLERLCLSGGEPILHPDLLSMISYAKSNGLEVFVYTSGIVLNNEGKKDSISNQTLNELKKVNLDRLIYNLQSPKEDLYNKIMGTKDCFNLVINSIKRSTNLKIYTEVHFVPMGINYKEIKNELNLIKELGVNQISFLRLVLQGRALKNRELVEMSTIETEELANYLSKLKSSEEKVKIRVGIPLTNKNDQVKCNAGSDKLIIRYDGAVYPCEAYKYIDCISENRIFPDNIKEKSLREIWENSQFLTILRGKIENFKNHDCDICPAQALLMEKLK